MAESLAAAGMSQVDLARAAETSHVNVLRWARGEVEPKIGTVERIASALGVSAAWLAYGDRTMSTYRAAILFSADRQGTIVLTGPEHAELPKEELLAEARAEMARGKVEVGDGSVEIGAWTEK